MQKYLFTYSPFSAYSKLYLINEKDIIVQAQLISSSLETLGQELTQCAYAENVFNFSISNDINNIVANAIQEAEQLQYSHNKIIIEEI